MSTVSDTSLPYPNTTYPHHTKYDITCIRSQRPVYLIYSQPLGRSAHPFLMGAPASMPGQYAPYALYSECDSISGSSTLANGPPGRPRRGRARRSRRRSSRELWRHTQLRGSTQVTHPPPKWYKPTQEGLATSKTKPPTGRPTDDPNDLTRDGSPLVQTDPDKNEEPQNPSEMETPTGPANGTFPFPRKSPLTKQLENLGAPIIHDILESSAGPWAPTKNLCLSTRRHRYRGWDEQKATAALNHSEPLLPLPPSLPLNHRKRWEDMLRPDSKTTVLQTLESENYKTLNRALKLGMTRDLVKVGLPSKWSSTVVSRTLRESSIWPVPKIVEDLKEAEWVKKLIQRKVYPATAIPKESLAPALRRSRRRLRLTFGLAPHTLTLRLITLMSNYAWVDPPANFQLFSSQKRWSFTFDEKPLCQLFITQAILYNLRQITSPMPPRTMRAWRWTAIQLQKLWQLSSLKWDETRVLEFGGSSIVRIFSPPGGFEKTSAPPWIKDVPPTSFDQTMMTSMDGIFQWALGLTFLMSSSTKRHEKAKVYLGMSLERNLLPIPTEKPLVYYAIPPFSSTSYIGETLTDMNSRRE